MENISDLTVSERVNRNPVCVKLSKDEYVNMATGEVGTYAHSENRGQLGESLRKTSRHVRELINTNVTDCTHVRWVTLTYRENMTDPKRLMRDYELFWKRFMHRCKKENRGNPEYISVIEPQGRGAWHIHALFIWGEDAPFIPNRVLADLWRHGFVSIKQPKDCDNLGAYFSGYLADMPEEDVLALSGEQRLAAQVSAAMNGTAVPVELQTADGDTKKIIKGARMALYPPGINIYRHSQGIRKPTIIKTTYHNAERYLQGSVQTYSQSFEIVDEKGVVVNRIMKASYNKNRKKED